MSPRSGTLDAGLKFFAVPVLQASFDVPIETSTRAARPTSPAREAVPERAAAAPDQEGNDQDADGSWVEVADEDVTRAKEKGKASEDENVLEDADK